jgi:hypothetical protein
MAQLLMIQTQFPPSQHFNQPHSKQNHHSSSTMSSDAAAATLRLLSTPRPSPSSLLWGSTEINADIDSSFSQQVSNAGRVMKIAHDAKATTATPRVAEVLDWLSEHNRVDADPMASPEGAHTAWRPCSFGALAKLGVNILSIEDETPRCGSRFVAENILPMMLSELSTTRPDTDASPDEHSRSLMVALHIVRLICDEVSMILADLTSNPQSADAAAAFEQVPDLVAILVASTDRFLRCLAQNTASTKRTTLFNWSNVANSVAKQVMLSVQCKTLLTSLSSANAAPRLHSTCERLSSAVVTPATANDWFHLFFKEILAGTSLRQHNNKSDARTRVETPQHRTTRPNDLSLLATVRPIEAINLLTNLEVLFRFGVQSASEVAQNVLQILPLVIHRGTPKDVIRFLVGLTRWRQQVNIASDHLMAQAVEGCQQAVAQKKVYVHDAISLLAQLGRLRFPVPLDLVDRLVDSCLAQQDYLTIPHCVNLVSSIRRIVESDISTGAVNKIKGRDPPTYAAAHGKHIQTWDSFREGKLDYVLHLVLQRVQHLMGTTPPQRQHRPATSPAAVVPLVEADETASVNDEAASQPASVGASAPEAVTVGSTSPDAAGTCITVSQALALVTSYADLNNTSSSFAMYRLMRPQLAALFDSTDVPSLKVMATLLGALSSLKLAVTTTYEEEELVRQAEAEATILLGRCSEAGSRQTIRTAPLADVIPLLTCVVQRLAEEKEAASRGDDQSSDDHDAEETVTSTATSRDLLESLLSRAAERCEAEAKGPQIGGLARLVSRIHRQQLAPQEWYSSLMEAVVRCSVTTLSHVRPGSEPMFPMVKNAAPTANDDLRVSIQRALMTGPHGGIAQHDVCAVIPLMSSTMDHNDEMTSVAASVSQPHKSYPFSMENAAQQVTLHHVWMVTLQRMCLLAGSVSVRDLRQWMHLLVNAQVLKYDGELFHGVAKTAFTALCDALRGTMSVLQLQDVAAFVASMHSVERDCFPTREYDEKDVRDSLSSEAVMDSPVIDAALRDAWHETFTQLAQHATQCLRMCRPPRTLSVADVRWSVKILKGISDHLEGAVAAVAESGNDGRDGDDGAQEEEEALIPQRVAFFYELLPILMREASSLNAVDLSLALHAYAKGGIWNIGAMAPLLRSACDGLALAPVKPCLGLLHTMVKSGFVREECTISLPTADEAIPIKSDIQRVARGSSEAMEHVAVLLVRRLWSEVSSPGGFKQLQLPEKELLALVSTLAYFSAPPRPLFDTVVTELRRRVMHRTLTEESQFSAALAPGALLAHAPLLRLGADHVSCTSEIVRQYISSSSWRGALLRQPTNRIIRTLSLVAASHLVVEPSFTVDEISSLQTFLWGSTEHLEAHASLAWFAQALCMMEVFYRSSSHLDTACGIEGFVSSGCVELLLRKVGTNHDGDATVLDYAVALKLLLLLPSGDKDVDASVAAAATFVKSASSDNMRRDALWNHPEVHAVRSMLELIDTSKKVVAGESPSTTTSSSASALLKKDLKLQSNVFILWLTRKPSVERVVWCLRILARQDPAVLEQLRETVTALDHLLVNAWSPDSRETESMMYVSALIADSKSSTLLAALPSAHFIPRLPIVLGRLERRAQRHGSLGIAYNTTTKRRLDAALKALLDENSR